MNLIIEIYKWLVKILINIKWLNISYINPTKKYDTSSIRQQ